MLTDSIRRLTSAPELYRHDSRGVPLSRRWCVEKTWLMRERHSDVLLYCGAQKEVVPVGSSQPYRPRACLPITPLAKRGNALHVRCISCLALLHMSACLKLLGRCVLFIQRSLSSSLDNHEGPRKESPARTQLY